MQRFIIIGLGNFGSSVAESLFRNGHDVIAVDLNESAVDRIAPYVTRAAVGDGTQRDLLEQVGAKECDTGIVSTGDDITASLLSTLALRDLDVDDIYVKVISRDHARIMRKMGVSETVFPEREAAENLGKRLSSSTVFNYVHLGTGFSVQEMAVPDKWEGKSLRDLELRNKHHVSVVAVHDVLTDSMASPPDPDAILKQSDTLLLAGQDKALAKLAKLE